MLVRPATSADVEFTAGTHRAHLPHGLFPRLGPGFMRRWHQTFLDAPGGIALVATRDGERGPEHVGFLVGSTDQVALVDHVVRHHRLTLGASGAWALLLRPRLAVHFLRSRAPAYARRLTRVPGRGGRQQPQVIDLAAQLSGRRPAPVAVVTALVVLAEARGAGAGEALVAAFVERARAAGTAEAQLTTRVGAGGAERFYERIGWQHLGVHTTRDDMLVATYRLDLTDDAPAPPPGPSGGHPLENGARRHHGDAR